MSDIYTGYEVTAEDKELAQDMKKANYYSFLLGYISVDSLSLAISTLPELDKRILRLKLLGHKDFHVIGELSISNGALYTHLSTIQYALQESIVWLGDTHWDKWMKPAKEVNFDINKFVENCATLRRSIHMMNKIRDRKRNQKIENDESLVQLTNDFVNQLIELGFIDEESEYLFMDVILTNKPLSKRKLLEVSNLLRNFVGNNRDFDDLNRMYRILDDLLKELPEKSSTIKELNFNKILLSTHTFLQVLFGEKEQNEQEP